MNIRSPLYDIQSVKYKDISLSGTFRLAPSSESASLSNIDIFFKTESGAYNLRTGLRHSVNDNVDVIRVRGYFQEEMDDILPQIFQLYKGC